MSRVQVFVSFDVEHDGDLYELLRTQSAAATSGFAVVGGSEPARAGNAYSERVRRQIREADQMVVICGEHTRASPGVRDELHIAQEEQTPYVLLWGRREIMCTKPVGAKPSEGMYSWTREILQDRIAFTIRKAREDATSKAPRDATPNG